MEEEELPSTSSSLGDGEFLNNATRERVFSKLRQYCLELLDLARNPGRDAHFLDDMVQFLRTSPGFLLQPCLDYALLPLFLLLHGAIECRSQQMESTQGKHVVTDKVAEAVLQCLAELMNKCCLTSVDQMVMVLKKLAMGASLPSSKTSEEFCEGIVRCLRALLLQLNICSSESCVCRQTAPFSAMELKDILHGHVNMYTSQYNRGSEDCLMAFIRSPSNSAAVGHWLSLLLKIAEFEAERGLRGSAELRKEAFITLRVFITKVGTPDALAFFLPGVLSRLGKALYVNKSMLTGAAGNAECIYHGIRALSELLVIVLADKSNVDALELKMGSSNELHFDRKELGQSILETLRQLPCRDKAKDDTSVVPSIFFSENGVEYEGATRSFHVQRTKDWTDQTSIRVNQLLAAVFPHLCLHPSEKVRLGVIGGIRLILFHCSNVLNRSKLMLLECLCFLVCDDSEAVSLDAQESVESLLMYKNKYFLESDLALLFNRLVETFPQVVLGDEEIKAISHTQKLSVLMYYVGPDFVVNNLLLSPVKAARFMEFLGSTFSQSSFYAGTMEKLIKSKPLSAGYLQSITELKTASLFDFPCNDATWLFPALPQISVIQGNGVKISQDDVTGSYELPCMPPWFLALASEKLYTALSRLLRLLGCAFSADHLSRASLSLLLEGPLDCIRKLISEIRMKSFSRESWQSWYSRSSSGHFVRQASASACIINEIIYGTSNQSENFFTNVFGKRRNSQEKCSLWKVSLDAKELVVGCVGAILSEYLSPEIWELPTDDVAAKSTQGDNLSFHFLRDSIMLHQVIIEGIGIFNLSLGNFFSRSGFMHSSIYLLLQNLICSSNQVRVSADAVLRIISKASGYTTVGHLVVSNADYIIDSLCRQLRHLDLNPHIPGVLSAMLSYVGAANEILPLLEEPMRSISVELEVLGRNQHPGLTVPFLKAIREIIRASRHEASTASSEAGSFLMNLKEINNISAETGSLRTETQRINGSQLEHWDNLLLKLDELRRYRRIVGSISQSCLKPVGPLLTSANEAACLVALDIVEDGVVAISMVEEGYRKEKQAKEAIEKEIKSSFLPELEDVDDALDGGADENRLLPMMNKIWPFLVLCMKNNTSVVVIRRCACVLSTAIQTCGGDFFIRRFRHDGTFIWKLLASPLNQKEQVQWPILPFRRLPSSSVSQLAEPSILKAQESILNLISDICSNPRTAPAMEAVLKKVAGLVTATACGGPAEIREPAIRALSALARIDSDLIWLLLADIVLSFKSGGALPSPPPDFPVASAASELLHVRYAGSGLSHFKIDPTTAEIVFERIFAGI